MKMILGTGTISNYGSYINNCRASQWPYKVPVNSLADAQLYINIGDNPPDTVLYQLIHTCGPLAGTIETITPASYIVAQDTNDNYYGVFKNFSGATPTCFVIGITLTFDGQSGDQIYFSEEYCIEACQTLTLLEGCYGNLDNKLSYDAEGIYFGTGEGAPVGDAALVYKHQLLLRNVEVYRSAIKNTFKQGRTRNFRTEKEKIYQFNAEFVPDWYLDEIDAVFYRGEVYVGGVKYLVNETQFELIEECKKLWKIPATFRTSHYQSFSCEANPCDPPVTTCCDPVLIGASVTAVPFDGGTMNKITVNFDTCTPEPSGGYSVYWRVAGSVGAYTNAGNFFIRPAIFYDNDNPEGTDYEGYIQTDCGGVLGNPVTWNTAQSGDSGTDEKLIYILNGSGDGADVDVDGVSFFILHGATENYLINPLSEITINGSFAFYRVRFWITYNTALYSEITAGNGLAVPVPVDISNVNFISIEPV